MSGYRKGLAGACAGLALVLIAAPAAAQTSGRGDASVRVLQSITVAKSADLNFGRVLPATSASTVVVAENGGRTCGANLRCFGATTAAGFTVTGTAGETVSVTIANPRVTLTNGSAGQTMVVTIATGTTSLVLIGGTGTFRVGGTLNVGANQAPGTYSGQFTVSVNYQ